MVRHGGDPAAELFCCVAGSDRVVVVAGRLQPDGLIRYTEAMAERAGLGPELLARLKTALRAARQAGSERARLLHANWHLSGSGTAQVGVAIPAKGYHMPRAELSLDDLSRHAQAMAATAQLLAFAQQWLAEPPDEFSEQVDDPWNQCLTSIAFWQA